ncbi:MAG: ABC transporter ATP-binding protein [Rhodospirillales bacterium]|nr:ABC transporter ATP-binding protein [Rhodospirillales bacterium]
MKLNLINVEHLPDGGVQLPDKLWPFLWYFIRQAKWQFALIAFFSISATALMSMTSYFIKLFVDALDGIQDREQMWTELSGLIILGVGLCVVLQSMLWRCSSYLATQVLSPFANMVRRQMAAYMSEHSYAYFQNDFAGRLSSKVMETPSAVRQIAESFTQEFIYSIVTFIVSFTLLAMTGGTQLLIVSGLVVIYVIILRIYLPQIQNLSKVAADNMSVVRGRHVDIVTNILNVKLFARKNHEDAYLLESLKWNAAGWVDKQLKFFSFTRKLDVLMKSIWVTLPGYALYAWQQGEITTGDVAMVMSLSIHVGFNMWGFTFTLSSFFESLGQVQEGMETLTKVHTVTDKKGAPVLTVKVGDIECRSMDFKHGANMIFDDFNLKIPAGQKVGLIGPSGAGKSSLVQLLLRLYDIEGGEILVDGQNIADVQQDSLREHIAVIPQSTDLLHRSLRENIGYGRLDATEDEIIAAAKRAHAHDFILNMEDKDGNKGYDAKVGERGVKLSGGQRQRIAIARAILKDAPILILDEATSALDSESEKLIQESLQDLMQGKTVIAIAHRLSTISHLDRLIVMDEGKIIEDGTHAQLLKNKGLYAKLWSMQSGGFLQEAAAVA